MAPRTARSERSCICGAILRASCAARLGPPCPARQRGKLAELAPPWRRLLLSIFLLQSAPHTHAHHISTHIKPSM